jgi:hypothetical protein
MFRDRVLRSRVPIGNVSCLSVGGVLANELEALGGLAIANDYLHCLHTR